MAHTARDKEKLLRRVQPGIGQVEAVKRRLEDTGQLGHHTADLRGSGRHEQSDGGGGWRATSGTTWLIRTGVLRLPKRAAHQLIDVVKAYVR